MTTQPKARPRKDMNNLLVKQVRKLVLATQNEINEYLLHSSVPLECTARDVDEKLSKMRKNIIALLEGGAK